MMAIKKVLIYVFLIKSTLSFSQTTVVNKDRINGLVTKYIAMLQNTYGDKEYPNLLLDGIENFENFNTNEVEYYLKQPQKHKSAASSFFRIINTKVAPIKNKIPIDVIDYSVGCIYHFVDPDTKETTSYAFANFNHIIYMINKTINMSYLLQIDVSNPTYKIKEIYEKTIDKEIVFFKDCKNNSHTEQGDISSKEIKIKEFQKEYLNQAIKHKNNFKYFEAITEYQKVINLNPNNTSALEGISYCKSKISNKNYIQEIEKLIQQGKYNNALQKINQFEKKSDIEDVPWIKEKKQICENLQNKQEYEGLILVADLFFDKKMFAKAQNKYKDASKYEIAIDYVNSQIEKCKNGDPLYVQKQIRLAYNKAVKSKKNYLSTFKVYKKYEISNLLKGEHFYFMTLMMLDKYKRVAKPMGYSKNQTKHLSRKYFYKAKELGYDVAYIENHVFTKSIEKR